MRDSDIGKQMVEQMALEHMLPSLAAITGREFIEIEHDDPAWDISPDFVLGVDGHPVGIEVSEIREVAEPEDILAEAYRIAEQKNASYSRRGLFTNPVILLFYTYGAPLFDIRHQFDALVCFEDFEQMGFAEIWIVDLNEAYYSPGHPFRSADVYGLKPTGARGFHRVEGLLGPKPYG